MANSSEKGKRFERLLGKVLAERFDEEFTRSLGSGSRWAQVEHMPEHANQTFASDIVCPEFFKFNVEVKGGYDDIDLHTLITQGNHYKIDEWIDQVTNESKRCGRKPLICWKRMRKPWVAILKEKDFKDKTTKLLYKGWAIINLSSLLAKDDDFFFNKQH